MSSPTCTAISVELQLAAAAPAQANGALLVVQGNVHKYVDAIKVLYEANTLPCPNLSPLLDMVADTMLPTPLFDLHMDNPWASLILEGNPIDHYSSKVIYSNSNFCSMDYKIFVSRCCCICWDLIGYAFGFCIKIQS